MIFFWPKDLKGYIFVFIYLFYFSYDTEWKDTTKKRGLLFKIVSNKCVYVK